LSFGSETGRTRGSTKGSSKKEKKQKRKKQEFHMHRRTHSQEAGSLDLEEVRARTILALDRLGHQVLSTEPGGYDLEHWMKSFNSLLNDFEEKVGNDHITEEFRARRKEAASYLAPSSTSSEVDSEIEQLTHEEESARAVLDGAEKKAAARLASLRQERDACSKELKAQKEKLAEAIEARQSRQFFSRILRPGPSTEQAQAKVAGLESKLHGLEDEIERSRKARAASGRGGPAEGDPAYLEAERTLEEVRSKLAEVRSARLNRAQLTREREIAAQTISEIISSMKLEAGPEGDGGMRA